MSNAEVVVVGAGVMGSATAWWLATRGVDVVVFEQFEAGHEHGSSHGGSRIFRLAYPQQEYVDMARDALDVWRRIEDDTGVGVLDITGGVDHGTTHDIADVADALTRASRPIERLTP